MNSRLAELAHAAGNYDVEEEVAGATTFGVLREYLSFGAEDAARLLEFAPRARPYFGRIVARFYEKVRSCPQTMAVLTGGDVQVARLRQTMLQWLETGLTGPHDDAFDEQRRRTGEVHVRIGLPQHLIVAAMNVMRIELGRVIDLEYADRPASQRSDLRESLHRWLDLELAIMIDAYRQASDERFRRKTRLAIVGQLAATIAHELRNPLSVLDSSLYILNKRSADARQQRQLQRMSEQLSRCHTIISDLLEVARESPPRCESVDLVELGSEVFADAMKPESVQLELAIAPGLRFLGDRGLLRQALSNLVGNAIIALRDRGAMVRLVGDVEGDHVVIQVVDDGPGFPPEVLPKAFEPLVTTRPDGTGLGLALVESVARRHGGTARVSNRPEGGATVTLRLPRDGQPLHFESSNCSSTPSSG